MPFDDFSFLFLFLPAVLAIWLVLVRIGAERHKWLLGLFLGAVSACYYWLASSPFFLLLALLTLFNFAVGWCIASYPGTRLYWLGIAIDVAVLGWFKYANFTIG